MNRDQFEEGSWLLAPITCLLLEEDLADLASHISKEVAQVGDSQKVTSEASGALQQGMK